MGRDGDQLVGDSPVVLGASTGTLGGDGREGSQLVEAGRTLVLRAPRFWGMGVSPVRAGLMDKMCAQPGPGSQGGEVLPCRYGVWTFAFLPYRAYNSLGALAPAYASAYAYVRIS